jgi:hypothetical protein
MTDEAIRPLRRRVIDDPHDCVENPGNDCERENGEVRRHGEGPQ